MQVLDASAAIDLLLRTSRGERVAERLASDSDVVAPELVYVEVLSAMHRLVRAGALGDTEAAELTSALVIMQLRTVSHARLLEAAWDLRDRLRIADAFYVACALLLDVPLLTTDARLSRVSLPGVTVTAVQ